MRQYLLYAVVLAMSIATLLLTPNLIAKGWHSYRLAFNEDVIPFPIEVTDVLSTGGRTGLIGGGGGCGGVVFSLSDRTISALESLGLSFLGHAAQDRRVPTAASMPNDRQYAEWRETPVPTDWLSEGLPSSLVCMNNDRTMDAALFKALNSSGSYFTTATRPSGTLFLLPKLEIAIYAYDH